MACRRIARSLSDREQRRRVEKSHFYYEDKPSETDDNR